MFNDDAWCDLGVSSINSSGIVLQVRIGNAPLFFCLCCEVISGVVPCFYGFSFSVFVIMLSDSVLISLFGSQSNITEYFSNLIEVQTIYRDSEACLSCKHNIKISQLEKKHTYLNQNESTFG